MGENNKTLEESAVIPGKGWKTFLYLFLWFLVPLFFGLYSLYLGKDYNWDFRNYHYYNAYAFLEGRLTYDIAPAQIQTYFNPLLDIPFYLLTRNYSAATVGFVFGFLHGFNLSLLFQIFWNISRSQSFLRKFMLGVFIIVLASTGPAFRSELGGTMNDNLISLFVLVSILLLIKSSRRLKNNQNRPGYLLVGTAGLILGLGLGLKMTIAPIVLASGLVLPFLFEKPNQKIWTICLYGFMGILGFLLSNGFWMWHLYTEFGNPLFPFYNHIFQSTFTAPLPFLDQRYLPQAWYEYLIWPILAGKDSLRVNELVFSDLRFEFLYILMGLNLIFFIFTRRNKTPEEIPVEIEKARFDPRIGNYLLALMICAYIAWMISFSYYRYIIPLEILVPLLILLVLDRVIKDQRFLTFFISFMLIIGLIGYQPFDWGRTNWSSPYVKLNTTQFQSEGEHVVVMLGRDPISYVIPEFPGNFRFIRPESNLGGHGYGLYEKVEAILSQATGNIHILYSSTDTTVDLNVSLEQLGLNLVENECWKLLNNIPDEIVFCNVIKK